jgi:hypothetical protein
MGKQTEILDAHLAAPYRGRRCPHHEAPMTWLVLESLHMPKFFRLHSKARWDSMPADKRYWDKVVKECVNRNEANTLLDELREKVTAARKGKIFEKGIIPHG